MKVWALASVLLVACTIIVVRPRNGHDATDFPDISLPDLMACGAPITAKSAHLIASVRSDRSLFTTGARLRSFLDLVRQSMTDHGVAVTRFLIAGTEHQNAFAAEDCQTNTTGQSLQDAASNDPPQATCDLDGLRTLSRTLSRFDSPFGGSFFADTPSYALVVVWNAGPRAACADPTSESPFIYPQGVLPVEHTFYLLVSTPEASEDDAAMATRCAAMPGFSARMLDAYATSSEPVFATFAEAIGDRAQIIDACLAFSDEGPAAVDQIVASIHDRLGLVTTLPFPGLR